MTDKTFEPALVARTSPRWLHIINLIWNGLAFLALAVLGVATLIEAPNAGLNEIFGTVSNRSFYLFSFVCFFFALMALIGFVDSARFLNKKSKRPRANSGLWLMLLILPFPLLLERLRAWENVKTAIGVPDWAFSLVLFLAILIPIVWMFRLASGKQWGRHIGRDASLFSWSVSGSIPFILIVEFLVILLGVLILFAGVGDLRQLIDSLDFQVLLQSPAVILLVFAVIALMVPLVEELFKTLAMIPLLGLRITPGEGFQAGLVSGAAFALFEGALYAAQATLIPDNTWVLFVLGRFGASLVHIANGGLIGWALAKTWQDRKFTRAVMAYLVAIGLHALWNGLVFVTQLLPTMRGEQPNEIWANWSWVILGILVAGGFILFKTYITRQESHQTAVYGS